MEGVTRTGGEERGREADQDSIQPNDQSQMLRRGPVFRNCRTRVVLFVEDAEQEKRQRADVARYCYQLRLTVEVRRGGGMCGGNTRRICCLLGGNALIVARYCYQLRLTVEVRGLCWVLGQTNNRRFPQAMVLNIQVFVGHTTSLPPAGPQHRALKHKSSEAISFRPTYNHPTPQVLVLNIALLSGKVVRRAYLDLQPPFPPHAGSGPQHRARGGCVRPRRARAQAARRGGVPCCFFFAFFSCSYFFTPFFFSTFFLRRADRRGGAPSCFFRLTAQLPRARPVSPSVFLSPPFSGRAMNNEVKTCCCLKLMRSSLPPPRRARSRRRRPRTPAAAAATPPPPSSAWTLCRAGPPPPSPPMSAAWAAAPPLLRSQG